MSPTSSHRIAQWWDTVEAFRDRAERILRCQIAQREDLATIGTTLQVVLLLDGSGMSRLERQRPTDMEIDQAAALCRPLFLEQDSVSHLKVTKAISGLVHEGRTASPGQAELLKALRKAWQDHEGAWRWKVGSSRDNSPGAQELRTDRQIARDFLYGDLVHADADARRRLRLVPEDERFVAAGVWATDAVRLVQATKRLIIDFEAAGLFPARPAER